MLRCCLRWGLVGHWPRHRSASLGLGCDIQRIARIGIAAVGNKIGRIDRWKIVARRGDVDWRAARLGSENHLLNGQRSEVLESGSVLQDSVEADVRGVG